MKNFWRWFKKIKIRKCRINEEWSVRFDSVVNYNFLRDKLKFDILFNYDVLNE